MTPGSARSRGPVVIDTGVFGSELVRRGAPIAEAYRPLVEGRPFIISFVTLAEIRFGAHLAGWGKPRLQRLEQRLAHATVVWPGPELVASYVDLRARCVRAGHALGQKDHEADRWIAATALWLGVPLVSHDAIFRDLDGVELLTKVGDVHR